MRNRRNFFQRYGGYLVLLVVVLMLAIGGRILVDQSPEPGVELAAGETADNQFNASEAENEAEEAG
jgi:hypothetical protein